MDFKKIFKVSNCSKKSIKKLENSSSLKIKKKKGKNECALKIFVKSILYGWILEIFF